ncbi:MAG: glycosyltransferase family 2 protein [Myxococcales bacterium]|nr:glycosyltransferase family 2 protein [Myxococcales bacterium]
MIKQLSRLSIIIPAYDEARRITPTLERITAYLSPLLDDYEVIVIDDGSKDETAQIVAGFCANHPHVHLRQNVRNRGKGYSVRHGMLWATGNWLLFSDADLSTPIEELERFASYINEFDVVIGSRGLETSNIVEHQPIYREWMGRVFNRFVQRTALAGLADTQCGFKLFSRICARDVFSRTTIDGFGFDVEALYVASALGYRIAEVPVTWANDTATKVHPVRDGLRMATDVVKTRWTHRGLTTAADRNR